MNCVPTPFVLVGHHGRGNGGQQYFKFNSNHGDTDVDSGADISHGVSVVWLHMQVWTQELQLL